MNGILDLIHPLKVEPLAPPIPNDVGLKKISDILTHNPAVNRTPEDWGKMAGATSQTLPRLFAGSGDGILDLGVHF